MEDKRYLKIFVDENAYESEKYKFMGIPHVIWLRDTDEIVYKSGASEDELLSVEVVDGNMIINDDVTVINDELIILGYNIFIDKKNKKYNIIIN